MPEYEPTIGLEVHVELKTKTKMFCDSLNDPNEKHPNLNVCPVCMGHPGTLPVINQEAIQKLVKVGLALNCQIPEFSKFDRKNYFYPDIPKGYQISQYDLPLCKSGWLELKNGKRIDIERIHMEEDTGRLQHSSDGKHSLVDFNRAGVPLIELVTRPDIKSGEEIEEFAKELRLILRYLDASDANMEKGQMRVEVNISVKPLGSEKLGTKVEIKNINSIKAAAAASDYEITRQTQLLESGGKLVQETRGWDENKSCTFSQRIKEGSADYRYFPEPDLPPLRFTKDKIEEIRLGLPELPEQRRKRFKKSYGLNDAQTEVFTIAKHLGNYYERVASELDIAAKDEHASKGLEDENPVGEKHLPIKLHSLAANYIITEFPPLFQMQGLEINDMEGIRIEPEAFAELMIMIFHQKLNSNNAKVVLKRMAETGLHPEAIVKETGLEQVSNTAELEKAVDEIIAKNPKAVEDYKKGKVESIKFLTGQVMAATRGTANPQVVSQILEQKLR
ncbi:MAG: glutaminyl-tRNA synthase (glutamine-hydrolyzing) subunit B [Candidatus Yanofskybacteria bacterium RIFCSPHIGHO2_01_FULL_44_17]|uniref:Aspartyl/glutamyl-tRNA(Asn/Gln) amidotransferase subunit B n=1 Tax=Candidatus Yanofskybacteria bacterium RIFCSPHIGHO2_01_FULL_44_17 TaxID=1802668 RepID=A0A1F8EVW6_9BACT|nr:MAG: glutaminyl-tRNA synthase (glutamine-hydrolyzing) subunit B [Candidatus Yanofskybacteria bacterium RIFCSPHIGHO2_01_FULL_44_17]